MSKFESILASLSKDSNEKKEIPANPDNVAPTDAVLASKLEKIEQLLLKTDDVDKLVAAKLAEQSEFIARNEAIGKYITLAASLGVKGATAEQFNGIASTGINAQIAVLEQLEASRINSEPVYKAYSEEAEPDIGKFTLGVPKLDSNGKVTEWRT